MPTDSAPPAVPILGESFNQFRQWLDVLPSHDHWPRWKQIGNDVYARKAVLILAAAALESHQVPNPLRLAATDVLVEKAQLELTDRATWMNRLGAIIYSLAIALLLLGAWVLYSHSGDVPKVGELDGLGLTLAIVRSSAVVAVLFASIYFMVALAKALFREGALLLNRRHALRYLRLCVYLTDGDIALADLRRMFNWNAEFTTAFEGIDPDKASAGAPLNKLVNAVSHSVKVLAELARRPRE